MMTIEHVTPEINRILAAVGAVEPKPAAGQKAKAAARKTAKQRAKSQLKQPKRPPNRLKGR